MPERSQGQPGAITGPSTQSSGCDKCRDGWLLGMHVKRYTAGGRLAWRRFVEGRGAEGRFEMGGGDYEERSAARTMCECSLARMRKQLDQDAKREFASDPANREAKLWSEKE